MSRPETIDSPKITFEDQLDIYAFIQSYLLLNDIEEAIEEETTISYIN